jgi:hypothetical protein
MTPRLGYCQNRVRTVSELSHDRVISVSRPRRLSVEAVTNQDLTWRLDYCRDRVIVLSNRAEPGPDYKAGKIQDC